jgi:hypothetical protein
VVPSAVAVHQQSTGRLTEVIIAENVPALSDPEWDVRRLVGFGEKWKMAASAGDEFPDIEAGLVS